MKQFFAGVILTSIFGLVVIMFLNSGISLPEIDSGNLVQYVGNPDKQQVIIVVTAVPEQVEPEQKPTMQTLVTVETQLEPGFAEATATAYFSPTAEFSAQFLADCALAMNSPGRRVAPRCPTNAAEMLGTGR